MISYVGYWLCGMLLGFTLGAMAKRRQIIRKVDKVLESGEIKVLVYTEGCVPVKHYHASENEEEPMKIVH